MIPSVGGWPTDAKTAPWCLESERARARESERERERAREGERGRERARESERDIARQRETGRDRAVEVGGEVAEEGDGEQRVAAQVEEPVVHVEPWGGGCVRIPGEFRTPTLPEISQMNF